MNIAELFKKNFVLVPVIASVLFGTFTGVKYVVNLTDTINANQLAIIKIQEVEIKDLRRDLAYEQEKMADVKTRLASAEATWQMAENLYNVLANTVREQGYDIKDVARDLLNNQIGFMNGILCEYIIFWIIIRLGQLMLEKGNVNVVCKTKI